MKKCMFYACIKHIFKKNLFIFEKSIRVLMKEILNIGLIFYLFNEL